ncbi:MAG: polysaccharide biosynthesis protein [Clostridiaceae bacterium]|nr:polysaccharide biosynthesis protein [Clostridiaceae bacterium]
MKREKTSSFFEGALILVFSNTIVKVIGALFSIPITNMVGGDGNGIFTVAYYIYTAMFVISTAGLPVAVSKMVAESNALGRYKEVKRIFRVAVTTFSIVGGVAMIIMMLGAKWFVAQIGNNRAYYAVLAVAPSIFFVSIISAFRGYFQGLSNMVPTAISQVIEAGGKLVFGLLLTYILIQRGYSLEIVVAGSIGGVTAGTVLSALYIILARLKHGSGLPDGALQSGPSASYSEITKRLIKIAVPITIGASVLSITNLIDMGVVLNRLQDAGQNEEQANFIYGCYNMAVKMFNMPQALIVALSVSIIPAVAAAYARKDAAKAANTITAALRFTGIMALPCAAGLAVLAHPILSLLYYKLPEEVDIASPLLVIISPAVLLVALVSVTNAILQAMGKVKVPVITIVIGGLVKLTTNYILVGTPGIEIYGAPIGTTLCYGSISLLNLVIIAKSTKGISVIGSFLKPFIAASIMAVFTYFSYIPLGAALGAKLGAVATIMLSALVYAAALIFIRALPKEEVLMLPKGEKIAKLLKL